MNITSYLQAGISNSSRSGTERIILKITVSRTSYYTVNRLSIFELHTFTFMLPYPVSCVTETGQGSEERVFITHVVKEGQTRYRIFSNIVRTLFTVSEG